MVLQLEKKKIVVGRRPSYESIRVKLRDGAETTVHIARYRRNEVHPGVVLFDDETYLLDWCQERGITDAVSAAFFLRNVSKPLGDIWIEGVKQKTESFLAPWRISRGSVYVNPDGAVSIAPRYLLPQQPESDLLQAGPLLIQAGQVTVIDGKDPEGFSAGSSQFDDDLTIGRYPRLAIGTNDEFIFSVACDGREIGEAGLTLQEFADAMASLGVTDALNLDGGSSANLIQNGKLRNRPRGGVSTNFKLFEKGRPVFSAIIFETIV